MMGTSLTVADLEMQNGEPRVEDLKLAGALGFTKHHQIRPLIKRHANSLRAFGEVFSIRGKPGVQGGRPGETFYLNRKQALYITAKSDTEMAAMVTVQMVEVFDAWQRGDLKPVHVKEHNRPPVRRRAQPGYGTIVADTDYLFPFIERGDELVVEFCTEAKLDVTQPSAIFVLFNPATKKPEPFWLVRKDTRLLSRPDNGARFARDVHGTERELVASKWPVMGRVIGINKPTTAERRAGLRH